MTPPDDTTLWQWLSAAVVGLGTLAWRSQNTRLKSIEEQCAADNDILREEVSHQRNDVMRVIERMEEYSRRSESRHTELLDVVRMGQLQLVQALHDGLSKKADK